MELGSAASEVIRSYLHREDFETALSLLRMYPKSDAAMDLERELFRSAKGKAMIPQRGPQERLMTTTANLVIYGGGAGGGKTHGTLMYPLRHVDKPAYRAVYFRKSNKEFKLPGGLWDECSVLWPSLFPGMKLRDNVMDARFPSGARISMQQMHLEGRKAVEGFKGLQAACVVFDETTAFEEDSVFYVGTRNRVAQLDGESDFPSQMLWTVNPDRDSWVFKFVRPWVDPDCPVAPDADGMCAMIRCEDAATVPAGVRLDDIIYRDENVIWVKRGTKGSQVVDYIHATLEDNLFIGDDYIARINSADRISRIRLIGGPRSWFIRHTAGEMFDKSWFRTVKRGDHPPIRLWCRSWDFGGRKVQKNGKPPDYTASVLVGVTAEPIPQFVIADVTEGRYTPDEVQELVKKKWAEDKATIGDHHVLFQIAGGEAGFHVESTYRRYVIPQAQLIGMKLTGGKITRAEPTSAAAEQGRVMIVDADWNGPFLDQCQDFPEVVYDDMVDAATAGVYHLSRAQDNVRAVSVPRRQSFNTDMW